MEEELLSDIIRNAALLKRVSSLLQQLESTESTFNQCKYQIIRDNDFDSKFNKGYYLFL